MSKTRSNNYAAWGEERKERSRLRDYENWKTEAMEDSINDEVEVVLVIKNYFEPVSVESVELMEIVGNRFFETDEEAWGHLSDIADAHGVELPLDANSFVAPTTEDLNSNYYVIEELWGA